MKLRKKQLLFFYLSIFILLFCFNPSFARAEKTGAKLEIATLGGGCFWCTEAVIQRLKGVVSVTSGYSGGKVKNPSYEEVCTGNTGHTEVIQISFDPQKVTFEKILEVFWQAHDPTTLNRQGNDIGFQYRSVIFYHDKKQKEIAEKEKKELINSGIWSDPVVTAIEPFSNFYQAEKEHQNYYNRNSNQPYCIYVIDPKVKKLKKNFRNLLKE